MQRRGVRIDAHLGQPDDAAGAYRALFRQYALLWRIGAANRARGFRPEPWRAFLDRRRRELDATPAYPATA